MAKTLRAYSEYLSQIGALIGVPTSRISTELAESLRVFFQSNMERVWTDYPWQTVCPNGEARFIGNAVTYPNDLSKTANWTATNLTITGDAFKNPLDGRTTASKLLETTTNGAHSVAQASISITQNTGYNLSAYARFNGRDWIYLKFNDGQANYAAFFDVNTGTVGTVSGTGATATIGQMPNGYWLCTLSFTSDDDASATGTATIQTSTDGSTLSYAGDTSLGLYVWGVLLQATTNLGPQDSLLPYDQTGEAEIESVFQVWQDYPYSQTLPRELDYSLTNEGIQVVSATVLNYPVVSSAGVTISSPQGNPIFLFYRKAVPLYQGDTFSASDTYTAGEQVYYTSSDGTSNYWLCVADTSAGQDPDDTPSKWSVREIPDTLFWPVVAYCYADWLTSDGQMDKTAGAYALAVRRYEDAVDKEARQEAQQIPIRMQTHLSTQRTSYY